MHGFECDYLRQMARNSLQQIFEMFHVVVPKDVFRHLAVSNTLDHRCMIATVGENVAVGKGLGQGKQCRVIGHVARSKEERRFFLM